MFKGRAGTPPSAAADLVKGYLRTEGLRPQVRLRTLRRGVLLHDAQARLLADVVDDAVSIVDGPLAGSAFRELEVETTEDTPEGLLDSILKRLRRAGAGPPDPTPKYLRAIGGIEAAAPEIERRALSKRAPAGEVITHAIADGVWRLLRHDPIVRLDSDPEGVHQARVATRRMRSDLRTFRALLDPDWVAALRAELGWLGGEFGQARDADVLLDRLRAPRAEPDGGERRRGRRGARRPRATSRRGARHPPDDALRRALPQPRRAADRRRTSARASGRQGRTPRGEGTRADRAPRLASRSPSTSADLQTSRPTRTSTRSGSSPSAAATPPRPARHHSANEHTTSPTPQRTCRTCSASSTTPSSPNDGSATSRPKAPRQRRSPPENSPHSNAPPPAPHGQAGPPPGHGSQSTHRRRRDARRRAVLSRTPAARFPRAPLASHDRYSP